MKAKVFVFGLDPEQDNHLFDFMISETFRPVMAAEEQIGYYPSVRDATAAISKAFSGSDVVLFFADVEKLTEVKHILCKALGLKLRVDQDLLARVTQSGEVEHTDAAAAVCHAGMPEKATPFALTDGMYSGFGVRRSKQTVVVLPVDIARLSILLSKQVIPYLNEFYKSAIPTEFAAYIYAYSLEDKLHEGDIQIAVSDTKTTALFRRYISNAGRLQDFMPVAAKAEQRGSTPPDEYVVNLSITAAEFFHAPYGIAMSNAYYTGDDASGEKKVYLAVTTETENTVREISSYYGESTSDFLVRCCGEMCALVEQIIDSDEGKYIAVYEEDEETQGKRVFRTVFFVFLALTALFIAFGVYYFNANGYTMKDWAKTHVPLFSYFVKEETTTAAPTAEATTKKAEPTTKKKKAETTSKKAEETTEETTAAREEEYDNYNYDSDYDDEDDEDDEDDYQSDYDYDEDEDEDEDEDYDDEDE